MAKTLKDFLNERQLGPMVVKNPDEQKFIDKHVVAKTDDRNGNDDELFKGSKVKMADRPKHRKGYNPGEDEEVYEALKGAQHKIDANKNGKVDAHDFHLLRKKKKVAEEAEELEELSKSTMGAYTKKAAADFTARKPKMGYDGQLKKMQNRTVGVNRALDKMYGEEVEELDENDALKRQIDFVKRDASDKGYSPVRRKAAREKLKTLQSRLKNEEVEELDELSVNTVRNYYNKAGEQGKKIADKMKMGGGDWSNDGSDTKTLKKRAAGRTMALKRRSGEIKMSEEAEQIDEISAEKKDAYAQKAGKQLPGLFAKSNSADGARKYYNRKNAVRKIANEEAEQIDELSKKTLDSYTSKASGDLGFTHGIAKNHRYAQDQGGAGRKPEHKAMDNNRLRKRASGLVNSLKRLAKEEADQIDEILDTPEKAANYKAKAQKSFSKNVWISGDKAAHQTAKKRLYGLSHPKVAEEVEIEEKLDMKKASMGTVIKDFQKSDAPQFQGKSQKKRQVMAIAAKLSAERGGKPLNKEERLLTKLADISETHKRTMVSVFEKLNEDNQREFMLACDTAEGIEQMLDFSIQHRGE